MLPHHFWLVVNEWLHNMNTFAYIEAPFAAWMIAGFLKFLINCLVNKRIAFDLIGYGGMPSNHSAIVSCMVCLVGIREGYDSAAFGVSLTLAFIVVIDANSLRTTIGRHAVAINLIGNGKSNLRERMGHSRFEIFVGIFVGCMVALMINAINFSS